MNFNWKQFAIALGLFLLGYFTFNGLVFGQTFEGPRVSATGSNSADGVSCACKPLSAAAS